MGRRSNKGRKINGVLLLDKPQGVTSNGALQQVKRLFFANKAGHTGSLDPLATGLLPICFGEATKFSQYLLNANKRYLSTFTLGVATETGDSEGEVISRQDASALELDTINQRISELTGEVWQTPSMYSALKHNGKPLYKYAREGITIEREARKIFIYDFTLLDFRPGETAEIDVEIQCSKGTYVRSIAEDLGKLLGCEGHVSQLRRTEAGHFNAKSMVTIDELIAERGEGEAELLDHHLMPVHSPALHLPEIILPESSGFYFKQGQAIMQTKVYALGDEGDMVRVSLESGEFIGIGEITGDANIAPKRIVA